MISSLLYAAVSTRPVISEAVGTLANFDSCPTDTHMTAANRVISYPKGTMELDLMFTKQSRPMIGYTDADYASDAVRNFKSGTVFINASSPISWCSRRQSVRAFSTTE